MSAHADIDVLLDGKSPDDLGIKVGALSIHETLAGHATFSLECIALDEGDLQSASGSQPSRSRCSPPTAARRGNGSSSRAW